MTTIKDLTITAEAKLVDTEPMATTDRADREFLPEKISVKYWPTPEGWRIWSIHLEGHAVLTSGELGKSTRYAFYGLRAGIDDAPGWVLEFADQNWPGGGGRG